MAQMAAIDINDLTKTITAHISITGYKKLRIKMYIGTLLIKFGIWIIGMKCEMETKE